MYSREEFFTMNRLDLRPARAERKSIFSTRLCRPVRQRLHVQHVIHCCPLSSIVGLHWCDQLVWSQRLLRKQTFCQQNGCAVPQCHRRAVGHHRDVVQGSLHQPQSTEMHMSVCLQDLALSSSSFRKLLKTTWVTSIQHTQRSRDAYDSAEALYKLYIDIWRGVTPFCIGSPVPLSQVECCIFLHCINHTCMDSAENG